MGGASCPFLPCAAACTGHVCVHKEVAVRQLVGDSEWLDVGVAPPAPRVEWARPSIEIHGQGWEKANEHQL